MAYQAFLPSLIERGDLVEGNTKIEVLSSVTQSVGPGLAGFLVQRVGAPTALALDAASFLVSALSVVLIKPPPKSPALAQRRVLWLEITTRGQSRREDGPAGRGQAAALLAALLLESNRVVASERLVDLLWGGEPRETATNNLDNAVIQPKQRWSCRSIKRRPRRRDVG